jgi:hypothetical protein
VNLGPRFSVTIPLLRFQPPSDCSCRGKGGDEAPSACREELYLDGNLAGARYEGCHLDIQECGKQSKPPAKPIIRQRGSCDA